MKWLKKIVAWVAKKLSKEQKAELFDKAVDKWAKDKPKEKEVIGPKTPFNTSRLDLRREAENKKKRKP